MKNIPYLIFVTFCFYTFSPMQAQVEDAIVNGNEPFSTRSGNSAGYGSNSYSTSTARYSNYEDVLELNVIFEAGKRYDSLISRITKMLKMDGVSKNRTSEDISSYNRSEKRYSINANVSEDAYKKIKDLLNAIPEKYEIRESSQRINFADTTRILEELKFFQREKDVLSNMLDTMNPHNNYYGSTSKQVINLISQISAKQSELREAKNKINFPSKLTIQIFTNYKDYYNRTNTTYSSSNSSSKYTPSWKHNFIPGLSFIGINPSNNDSIGNAAGIAPEFSLFTRFRASGGESNPSFMNVYARLGILKSEIKNVPKTYYSGIGLRVSFENKVKRTYLIPFFADELSYFYNQKTGGAFANIPNAGIYLFANKQVQTYLSAGYVYPFRQRETYESFTFSGGLSFLLWR